MTQMPTWLADALSQTTQDTSPLGGFLQTVPSGPTIEPLLTEAGLYGPAAPSVRDMLKEQAFVALFPETSPPPSGVGASRGSSGPTKTTSGSGKMASKSSAESKGAKPAGGVGASDGGMDGLRKMLETVFPTEAPSKRLAEEREKTMVLQERLKRNQMVTETRAGRRLRELQERLSFLGVEYDPEADIGELERLLAQHRRQRNMKDGPGEPLTDAQKKTMSGGVRREGPEKGPSRAERGKAYEADQKKKRRQRAADVLTGGDTRTLDYIDTGGVGTAAYREMTARRAKEREAGARQRGAQRMMNGG